MFEIKKINGDINTVREMRRGMTKLGSGMYAKVYSNPGSNRVIRVSSTSDIGYLTYVQQLAKCSKQNPYAPVIYSATIVRNKQKSSGFLVVELEKLQPLKIKGVGPFEYMLEDLVAGDGRIDVVDCRNHFATLGVSIPPDLVKMVKLLRKAGQKISAKAGYRDVEYDLHLGNVMLRGNQLVFTDPFACELY